MVSRSRAASISHWTIAVALTVFGLMHDFGAQPGLRPAFVSELVAGVLGALLTRRRLVRRSRAGGVRTDRVTAGRNDLSVAPAAMFG